MNHAVIIRMHYPECEAFYKRLELFRSVCLPSFEAQTDKDFDIVVVCNEIHKHHFDYSIHPDVRSFYGDGLRDIKSKSVAPFDYELPHVIQTRLDSDDFVSPDFIETIHANQDVDMLCFKPIKVKGKDRYRVIAPDYKVSQFLSVKGKGFIYKYGHRSWWKHVDTWKVIDFGYCFLSVHNGNASTKIRGSDERI